MKSRLDHICRRQTIKPLCRLAFNDLFAVLLGLAAPSNPARADTIFVTNSGAGTIGEYTTSGATVNASLISAGPSQLLAVSGSDLFVLNSSTTIGEYTTSGATVNASLISGLNFLAPIFLVHGAVYGSDLFITNSAYGTVSEYTTSGVLVNASLISGVATEDIAVYGSDLFVTSVSGTVSEYTTSGALVNPSLILGPDSLNYVAVSGSDLFIATFYYGSNADFGAIGEYTTSGATVNALLIKGLDNPGGLALSGSDLFVTNVNTGTIGEYTTSGATVNASLISGLNGPTDIVIVSTTPEPSTFVLVSVVLGMMIISVRRTKRRRLTTIVQPDIPDARRPDQWSTSGALPKFLQPMYPCNYQEG